MFGGGDIVVMDVIVWWCWIIVVDGLGDLLVVLILGSEFCLVFENLLCIMVLIEY